MKPTKGEFICLVNEAGVPYFSYAKVEDATDKAIFVSKKWIPRSTLTYNGTTYIKQRGMHAEEYILSDSMAKKIEWL